MSAASVSRSSALPEIPLPSRRSPDRDGSEQAFTLPPEPADRPRPRLDDDRGARDDVGARDQTRPDDGARKTSAADTRSSARPDDDRRDRKAADAKGSSEKTKADAGSDQAATKDAAASEDTKTGTAASDKPAEGKTTGGKTIEERKAALAAALDGAPVIGKGTLEEQAAAGAVMQPVPPPAIGAEFLALAAAALQGSESATPEGATAQDGKAVTAANATEATAQAAGTAIPVPVPPALPAKADGQASAGGEAAAADIKAGLKPQLPAAGSETKTDAKSGEIKAGEAQQSEVKTAETKPGDMQASAKDDGEAGKVAATAASSDAKATGDAKPADTTPATAASGQTTQAASTDAASGAQQMSAPLSPQAILAQSLTAPQAPLTELDAAAQATARAQAEAAHKLVSGDTGRPTPLHVVPIEIGAKALAGNKRFDIRLDPAELGRIDVSLEISDKGDVSAKLTVDRVETLHMLQRDARTLERAFEQAGLKPSEGGIDLSLRDPGQQAGGRQQQGDEAPRGRRAWVEASEDSALVTDVATLPRNASRLGGVDLSI